MALSALVLQVFAQRLQNAWLWLGHYASPSNWPDHLLLWINLSAIAALLALRFRSDLSEAFLSSQRAVEKQGREKARIARERDRREAIRRAKASRERRQY